MYYGPLLGVKFTALQKFHERSSGSQKWSHASRRDPHVNKAAQCVSLHPPKTRLCSLPEGTFDFLGYTFGRSFSYRTRRAYLGASPSRKKIAKLCDAIRELTSRRRTGHEVEYVVGKLNQKLVGWANYFQRGHVTKAYGVVNYHLTNRLRRWLCAKHKVRGPGYSRYPDAFLYEKLGLYQLRSKRHNLPNASA